MGFNTVQIANKQDDSDTHCAHTHTNPPMPRPTRSGTAAASLL